MQSFVPTVGRMTDYALQDSAGLTEVMNAERVLDTPLIKIVDHRYGFTNMAATLPDAALGVMGELATHGLDKTTDVLVLSTVTSGVPYAPALARVIGKSMVESPRLHTGYILAKRNVTHAGPIAQSPEIEEYVAEKGYGAIRQDEAERLRAEHTDGATPPDAVVLFDETEYTGGTKEVARHILTTAFGDQVPIITLAVKADLPFEYKGRAQLVVDEAADGKRLAVTDVDPRTKSAFDVVAEESIRYIQEAVRGQHPELVEAFPGIDFDLTGEKKAAVLAEKNERRKLYLQNQIADFEELGEPGLTPTIEALKEHLAKQDKTLAENLSLFGLVHHARQMAPAAG